MSEIIATVMRASVHHFIGRLGAEPEIKYLESGKVVAKGRIAVNQMGGRQGGQDPPPDWFTVEVWGDKAQGFVDQFHKGDLIEVAGRVKSSRWTDRQGVERVDLIVVTDVYRMVAQGQGAPAAAPAQTAPAPAAAPAPGQAQQAYAAAGWQPPAQAAPAQAAPVAQGQQALVPPPVWNSTAPAAADDIPF